MVEQVEELYHEIEPPFLPEWEILERAQVEVNQARRAQSVAGKSQRAGGERKSAAALFVCSGQSIDGSPAAQCHDGRDFDMSQDRAERTLFFFTPTLILFIVSE